MDVSVAISFLLSGVPASQTPLSNRPNQAAKRSKSQGPWLVAAQRSAFECHSVTPGRTQGRQVHAGSIAGLRPRSVQLKLIQPGKPTQSTYIERFNGKFRDECLNAHWLQSLGHARAVIQAWRQDYNQRRPHSMLATKPLPKWLSSYGNEDHQPGLK